MASLIENLNSILSTKEEIKEVLGTENEVFSDYPALISAAIAGGGGITPEGTYTINSNGTYDVTAYAYAYVNVSGGSGIRISSASIATDMQYPSMNAMTLESGRFTYTMNDSDVANGSLTVYLETSINESTYYTGGYHTCGPVGRNQYYIELEDSTMNISLTSFTFYWQDYGMSWTGDISNVIIYISSTPGINGFQIRIDYTISNYQEIGPTPSEKNGRYLVTFGDPMNPTEVFEQFSQDPMDGTYNVNSVYGGLCEIRDYSMDVLTDTWKPSMDTILDPALNIDFLRSVELGNANTGNLTVSSGFDIHIAVHNDQPYIWYYNGGGGSSSSESGSSEVTGDTWMLANADAAGIMSSDSEEQFENPSTGMMETATVHAFYSVPLNSFFGQGGDDNNEVVHPFYIIRNGMDYLYAAYDFEATASDIIDYNNQYDEVCPAGFNPMDYHTSPITITTVGMQTLPMDCTVKVYEIGGMDYFIRVHMNYA